uniref:Putative ras similarity family n=1 Tax=Xenopsylla cheopis TaxID=163159 RepID=A0A6M2DKX3_XENCH
MTEKANKPIKITAVGDGYIGKTCLLITYTKGVFPEEYVPTVFDNYSGNITVDGREHGMTLWDTAGQEDYERLRPLSYPNTDCFLLCYSIGSRDSFENVHTKWYPEIRHFSPRVPIVLVATKSDLRMSHPDGIGGIGSKPGGLVTHQEGKKMRNKIRAHALVECSAMEKTNLDAVFEEAIRATAQPVAKRRVNCKLL